MRTSTHHLGSGERATTTHAAAGAGIAFAVLFATAVVLLVIALPDNPQEAGSFTPADISLITWAVRIVPFAGIAFLWFLGAMRQRLGTSEDQFFATVTLGSGLLFVAMIFVAFAFISGMLVARDASDTASTSIADYVGYQSITQQIFTTYALKMAAVFMASLSLLWRRTAVMPKALAILTLILAVFMLITTTLNPLMVLIFPIWVLVVSIYLFTAGLRRTTTSSSQPTE